MNARNHDPGVCRYCRCTEGNACRLPDGDGCAWFDAGRTLCNSPVCLNQYFVDDMNARRADFNRTLRRQHNAKKKRVA